MGVWTHMKPYCKRALGSLVMTSKYNKRYLQRHSFTLKFIATMHYVLYMHNKMITLLTYNYKFRINGISIWASNLVRVYKSVIS